MGIITDIIKGLPLTAIQAEKIGVMDKRIEELEAENTRLKEELGECIRKLLEKTEVEQFVEHDGALFKKLPGNGYAESVYCPRCKTSTFSPDNNTPFFCLKCKWAANFGRKELNSVMRRLPE